MLLYAITTNIIKREIAVIDEMKLLRQCITTENAPYQEGSGGVPWEVWRTLDK